MDYFRPYNFNASYQPQQQQVRSNKIYVTSLDDALNRYIEPNTVIVYRNQNEEYEYEIMSDNQGKKAYKTYKLSPYSAPQDEKDEKTYSISREDFETVKSRINALEKEISNFHKEEKHGGLE